MKKLIVLRHAEVDGTNLTEQGRKQITKIAEILHGILQSSYRIILSSDAHRAVETARLLGDLLFTPYHVHDILYSDGNNRENCSGTLELIRVHAQAYEVIILVTHFEYASRFPPVFAKEELGIDFRSSTVSHGTGWIIDCEQKIIVRIT